MFSNKPLKTFLFPAANILLALFMLRAFFIADVAVVQTFSVAHMNALRLLKPASTDYFWELTMHNGPIDKSTIQFYVDFYEQLLQVYPFLRDSYGILGFCYHYLGNDTKAIDDLKKAILYNPLFTWNYYNLAVIYLSESRYQEASYLFQEMQLMNPQKSLQRMFASRYIYLPLTKAGGKNAIEAASQHLKLSYRVSFDLIQMINRMSYSSQAKAIINKMKLETYAF